MTSKSVLVVGAGIGGLSVACYAQMNGYRVRVLEMHNVPGGSCTAWRRDGYTFDGCIHNLAGSSPGSAIYQLWRELGVVPATLMHTYDELVRVARPDGDPLIVYTDLERLAEHVKQLAPGDAALVDEIVRVARRFNEFDLMGLVTAGPVARLAAVRMAPTMIKYGATMEAFAKRFTDPFLRRAFPALLYDGTQTPVLLFLSMLGRLEIGDYGWPAGGSAEFARAIEQRFLQLGGEISYGSHVISILTDENRAIGVRLCDGSEQRADVIVSNAYGPATIFGMLDGKYVSSAIRSYYAAPVDRIPMGIHVSLGIARELEPEPHAIVQFLETPVMIAGEQRDRFFVEPFGFDDSLAPAGKSVLKVVFATSYKHWEQLHTEPERYAAEKSRIAETVIAQLEPLYPGLRRQVEVIDVATPMTMQRFTGISHGFQVSTKQMLWSALTGKRLSQTLPGLRDFYMVGQWAGAPGLPVVAAMGRDVAREICRTDGKTFVRS